MKRVDVLNMIHSDYDFIVEIGAGPIPFYGTKVIIDKYPFENSERCANIKTVAPLIKADACSLPFLDKSIDLLFMSQVIEHLPDPILFLKEAKRTAKDIYIESPSSIREVLFGWSFHRWVIKADDGKWTFYKNDLPQLCAGHFHNEHDIFFIEYTINNFEKLNNYYYGSVEKLKFEISDITALEYLSKTNQQKTDFATTADNVTYSNKIRVIFYLMSKNVVTVKFRNHIKNIIFSFKRSGRATAIDLNEAVKDRLMCISCKKPLTAADYTCSCGLAIKRINGILTFDKDDY